MFFIVFLLGFLSVYAQEDDLIVLEDDDRSETDIEKLLDADQNEKNVEVNDNNDRVVKDLFVESEVYDTVKVKNMSPFSETNMHWGGSVHLGGASLNGLYGPKGEVGFAFSYFFYKKMAIQCGLDFYALVLRDFKNTDKVIYSKFSLYDEEWEKGISKTEVSDYTVMFMGFSLPLALRIGNPLWGELGILFDYVYRETFFTLQEEIATDVYGDPFKPEWVLYPKLLVGLGINKPMDNWFLDMGLQFTLCLKKVETDFEQSISPLLSIEFIFNIQIIYYEKIFTISAVVCTIVLWT